MLCLVTRPADWTTLFIDLGHSLSLSLSGPKVARSTRRNLNVICVICAAASTPPHGPPHHPTHLEVAQDDCIRSYEREREREGSAGVHCAQQFCTWIYTNWNWLTCSYSPLPTPLGPCLPSLHTTSPFSLAPSSLSISRASAFIRAAQWAKREIHLVHFDVEGIEMKLKPIAHRFGNRLSVQFIDSLSCGIFRLFITSAWGIVVSIGVNIRDVY